MTIEQAIKQLERNSEYKLEKPKVTDEDIEKMSFEEKKWFMIFLVMSMNGDRVGTIFNETWMNEMVKKLYSM